MPEGIAEGIGASVRRKEDRKFITGRGRYTDDINRAGQLHAFFVRSDVAHAKIKSVDIKKAAAMDGVAAVYTGQDIADDGVGGLICGWVVPNRDGSATHEPPHPILAKDKVRYVGDHVAMVVADSLATAQAAAELVNVTYETLPAVVDLASAATAAEIHDGMANNTYFDWELGDEAATATRFQKPNML